MITSSCVRNVVRQAGYIGKQRALGINTWAISHAYRGATVAQSRKFRTFLKMMVDMGETAKRSPIIDVLPGKDEDNGYSSGGWKR